MSEECVAEFVDGSWTYEDCDCRDCNDAWSEGIDRAVEDCAISEEEAHDRMVRFEQFGMKS